MRNWHRHRKNMMSKILLYIIFFYFLIVGNLFSASEINESGNKECSWYNKIPCIQIKSNISNTSKFSEIGIKKTIISRREIEDSGAIDLIDILNVIPNISITQSGPRGQTASLFMRGAGSNHTLVLINGVAINDQSQTQGLYDFGLDFIQTIHQVEVYQGAGGSNFGANSIAGAINIITKADYKDSFNFSSFNKDNYDFLINKNYITDNSSTLNFKIGGVNSKTNSARYGGKEEDEINNLSGNLNFESWLNTNIKVSNSTYLRQTISEYDNSKSNEIGFEGDNKMLTSQFGLSNIKKDSEDKFIFYYNKYDREYDEQGIIDFYDSEATGLKYDRSGIFIKNLSYGIGSEYRYDWGEFINNGSYSASTKGHYDNTSIYGNLGWNFFENTNLSLFLRNDDNKITGSNETYKLNLQQKMNQLTFGMSRMTGLRNPTIYELFGTDNYGYSGNKFLQPEKSYTNQLYGDYNFNENLVFSLLGYKSSIYEQIEYKNNKYVNNFSQTDLNQSGIDAEINFFNEKNKILLYSSFQSSKKTDGSDQLRRPEKVYGLNLNRKLKNNLFGKFQLNLTYKHYGKHFDTHSTSFSTVEMDSSDIVDISLRKNFGQFNVFLNSTNIFDEKYQRPHGYSQEGRLFRMGLKSIF